MAAKGYCDAIDVAAEYGDTLTATQSAQAMDWLEAAELVIDHATGQAWLTGPVIAERHWLFGPWLTLRSTMVTGIDAVRAYAPASRTATVLTADTDYWLEGTTLHLPAAPYSYNRVEVDYTPAATVPAPIRWATAALLANGLHRAEPALAQAQANGLRQLQIGFGELLMEWGAPAEGADPAALPPRVMQLLATLRPAVVVA